MREALRESDWEKDYYELLFKGMVHARYFDEAWFARLQARAQEDGLLTLGWVRDAWDESSWINFAMRDGSVFPRDEQLNAAETQADYHKIVDNRDDLVEEWGETLIQARERQLAKMEANK